MNSDNKYNNGKIYTIRCTDNNNLIYVGSTTQPLYKRWYEHKQIYNKEGKQYNKLLYIKMRELGFDKFYIELYENINCENIEQLHRKEGEIIRQIATLNKNIAGLNVKENMKEYNKEYYEENKEKIKETKKEYYKKNKEQILEKQKEYYEKNKFQKNKKNIMKIIMKKSKITMKKIKKKYQKLKKKK